MSRFDTFVVGTREELQSVTHITPTVESKEKGIYICLLSARFLHHYAAQDTGLRTGAAHSGLNLPDCISKQGDLLQAFPTQWR